VPLLMVLTRLQHGTVETVKQSLPVGKGSFYSLLHFPVSKVAFHRMLNTTSLGSQLWVRKETGGA
jgi:hypothetical protein